MTKPDKIILSIVIVISLAYFSYFKIDYIAGIEIADIQHGFWEKTTYPGGHITYSYWVDPSLLSTNEIIVQALQEHQESLKEAGITEQKIQGYGLRFTRLHKFSKKVSEGKLHVFETEESAVQFAKENGMKNHQIHLSNQWLEPTQKTQADF